MSNKSLKFIVVILLLCIIALVVWNWSLTKRVKSTEADNIELENKFNARKGDLDVLKYDLVTVRDSSRILRNQLNECWSQGSKFTIE